MIAIRRRPTAVYRVIDEEELLGGDGVEIGGADALDTVAMPVVAALRRSHARRPAGLVAGVVVATLAAAAVALTAGVAAPHRAAAAAAPRAATAVPRPRRLAVAQAATSGPRRRSPLRAARARRGVPAPTRRTMLVRRRRATRRVGREAAPTRFQASAVVPARARAPQPSPAAEFGFER